jgi:hypothetical protein
VENSALDRWLEPVEPFLGPLSEVAAAYTELTGVAIDVPAALFLRARLAGLDLPGRTSAGGSCHLLRASDGWAALNLSRPDDLAALPALLGILSAEASANPLDDLREVARARTAAEIAAGACLLGMAGAELGSVRADGPVTTCEPLGDKRMSDLTGLTVVDLSALWAGPLCARLLGLAGARVVKVESTTRPDGARLGSPAFYQWLHDGHESVVVDFASGELAEIIAGADVVIEASRPRAMRRLGIHAERFLAAQPGRVWVSITGYGRDDDRIAFGDDAAVAAALTGRDADGDPIFLGDAIADPITGIFAAHATAHSLAGGGGDLLSIPMTACASALAGVSGC